MSFVRQCIREFARNEVEVATPFFASVNDFVMENRGGIRVIVGAVTAV